MNVDHRVLFLAALALSGCEKDLTADPPDAGPDADTGPCTAPASDAHAAPAHTLYLNFDGGTITSTCASGAADSSQNCTSLLPISSTNVPAYQATDANRQVHIDLIVGYVSRALAPYSVDVVTARPASGDYVMAMIGGGPEAMGFPAGILSAASPTCEPLHRGVSFAFESASNPVAMSNSILSDLGATLGLAVTSRVSDCMNRTGPPWADFSMYICTFDAAAPTVDASQGFNCGRSPTQDEPALLKERLGCRAN